MRQGAKLMQGGGEIENTAAFPLHQQNLNVFTANEEHSGGAASEEAGQPGVTLFRNSSIKNTQQASPSAH